MHTTTINNEWRYMATRYPVGSITRNRLGLQNKQSAIKTPQDTFVCWQFWILLYKLYTRGSQNKQWHACNSNSAVKYEHRNSWNKLCNVSSMQHWLTDYLFTEQTKPGITSAFKFLLTSCHHLMTDEILCYEY